MKPKNEKNTGTPWNSLEVSKLVVSLLIPLSVVFFGYLTSNALQNKQAGIDNNRRLMEKRQEIYEVIRIPLNDIYVYIADVGHYKDLTPQRIIDHRRMLHTMMHTNRAYWSVETFSAYLKYMDEIAFKTYVGVNKNAKIRDNPIQKKLLDKWQADWQFLHTGSQDINHKAAYKNLLDSIAIDIGAGLKTLSQI